MQALAAAFSGYAGKFRCFLKRRILRQFVLNHIATPQYFPSSSARERNAPANHAEHDAPVAANHPAKRRIGREPSVAQKRKHDSDGDHECEPHTFCGDISDR
jgi:hypothetical protein